jgi:hypothetical protein
MTQNIKGDFVPSIALLKAISISLLVSQSTSLSLPLPLLSLLLEYPVIGRKAFFSKRDKKAKERRRLLRQRNGYIPGAYKKEDALRNKDKKLLRTKKLY